MLIRLFQHNSICWDRVLVERPGKICAAPYLLIRGRLAPSPETKQGLERGHGLPAPIVAEGEFSKINLKLIAAHAVIGSDQPLLEIPNGAVRQRQQHKPSRLVLTGIRQEISRTDSPGSLFIVR